MLSIQLHRFYQCLSCFFDVYRQIQPILCKSLILNTIDTLWLNHYLCKHFTKSQLWEILKMTVFLFLKMPNQGTHYMRRILNYRKILNVSELTELRELKSVYRNLMKEWHPDKFQDNHDLKLEAEEKSKKIIEAYHFLVSIAPETREQMLPDYTETTTYSTIVDFEYKSELLIVRFSDGNEYEYYGVPKPMYVKLINAETPGRFARRHIFFSYLYRSTTKQVATV
jgi:hypothetical protein